MVQNGRFTLNPRPPTLLKLAVIPPKAFLRKVRQIGHESARFGRLLAFMGIDVDHSRDLKIDKLKGNKKDKTTTMVGAALGKFFIFFYVEVAKMARNDCDRFRLHKKMPENMQKCPVNSLHWQGRQSPPISKILSLTMSTLFEYFDVFVVHKFNMKEF